MSGDAVAVVNVRMGSSRLPGKVLRTVHGAPLLQHLLSRLRLTRMLDRITVATSVLQENDPIAAFCAEHGVACFRGSEDDVLKRTLGALQSAGARIGVVVFGDGPLVDPQIIDETIACYVRSAPRYDFVGNDLTTTYPPGMEVEVFPIAALADADRRCEDAAVREHSTLFIRQNPGLYHLHNLSAPPELCRPELELEVDTQADLDVVAAIIGQFAGRCDFHLAEVIAFLDAHPEIAVANRDVPRRWRAFRIP